MTVRLADDTISELEQEGKIVRCIAVVCRVCGFRQHVSPNRYLPLHERCPNGCILDLNLGRQCRLCGDPRLPKRQHGVQSKYCAAHLGRKRFKLREIGVLTTTIDGPHWHAAEGAGPVSQYAVVI